MSLFLDRYHSKNELAFLWTFQEIIQSSSACYFWTLTPEEAMPDWRFALAVNRFCQRWQRYGNRPSSFKALRVFEPFKSGYLHCHFVVNDRYSVRALRRVAFGTGIGRIHVHPKKVTPALAIYLLKYIGKNRSKLEGGLRSWAKWGPDWQHSKVCNIEVDSEETRHLKSCYVRARLTPLRRPHIVEHKDGRLTVKDSRHIGRSETWVKARVLFYQEKREMLLQTHGNPF